MYRYVKKRLPVVRPGENPMSGEQGPLYGWDIIEWQEQVVQLIMDVGGMNATQADEVRRAFARPNNEHLIATH